MVDIPSRVILHLIPVVHSSFDQSVHWQDAKEECNDEEEDDHDDHTPHGITCTINLLKLMSSMFSSGQELLYVGNSVRV